MLFLFPPVYTYSLEIALEQCQGQLSQVAKNVIMNST